MRGAWLCFPGSGELSAICACLSATQHTPPPSHPGSLPPANDRERVEVEVGAIASSVLGSGRAGGQADGGRAESDRCPQLTTDHLCMRKMEMGSIAFRRREKVRASEVCTGKWRGRGRGGA